MGAVGMVITNATTSNENIKETNISTATPVTEAVPEFQLSRNGRNVVFLFVDRAASVYMPYVLNERPQLMEAFSGFTYYQNTLSFGTVTYQAGPAMLGGYDYLPSRINAENDELIIKKTEHAWDVIPYNMSENGFTCTLTGAFYLGKYNPPYDLTYFDKKFKNTHAFQLLGKYVTNDLESVSVETAGLQNRNFFMYSLMKCLPIWGQNMLYDDGVYYSTDAYQYTSDSFIKQYSEIDALPYITGVTDSDKDTYLFIESEMAHEPTVLNADYQPAAVTALEKYGDRSRFTLNGRTMRMVTDTQIGHYNAFMSFMIQTAEWMEYLKEQGVYDNTRIIIVSDHGNGCTHFDDLLVSKTTNLIRTNPLLMVKDFNSTEWTISDEFMTNADVPSLVFEGLVENPINPATGEKLAEPEKEGMLYIPYSNKYNKDELINHTQIYADQMPWGVFEAGNGANVLDVTKWHEMNYADIDFDSLY